MNKTIKYIIYIYININLVMIYRIIIGLSTIQTSPDFISGGLPSNTYRGLIPLSTILIVR